MKTGSGNIPCSTYKNVLKEQISIKNYIDVNTSKIIFVIKSNKRVKMALNRSLEFNGVIVQIVCALEIQL